MVVCSEALCSWTGSNADRPTDQRSFTKTHLLVINGQVSHTAHIGLPGGNVLWQERIWEMEERSTWLERFEVCVGGEEQKKMFLAHLELPRWTLASWYLWSWGSQVPPRGWLQSPHPAGQRWRPGSLRPNRKECISLAKKIYTTSHPALKEGCFYNYFTYAFEIGLSLYKYGQCIVPFLANEWGGGWWWI